MQGEIIEEEAISAQVTEGSAVQVSKMDVNPPQSSMEQGGSPAALDLLGGYDTAQEESVDSEVEATAEGPCEPADSATSHQLDQSYSEKETIGVSAIPAITEADTPLLMENETRGESVASEVEVSMENPASEKQEEEPKALEEKELDS
uniref:Uncharacterized protein n=1 Tax=Kalanchoe fedtschenkoi TaxID=63787 RepID=A0A7N1A3M9_KALFE